MPVKFAAILSPERLSTFMDESVDSFPRLWPYLRPYRKKLTGSIILGLAIAALWGGNLTVAYPVIKLLLQHTSLHTHVDESIATASQTQERLDEELVRINDQLQKFQALGVADTNPETVELLQRQARVQRDLAKVRLTLYQFGWLKCYVMPWVPNNEFQTLAWLLAMALVATALKGALIFSQDVLIGSVAESAVMGLRKDLLKHSLRLDYQSLSIEGNSGLMSRFTYDAEQLSQGICILGGRLIREPLKCLSCMVLALYFNWRLTLLSLIFIPLLGLFLSKFGKMLKRASRRMMESMSQIYKVLEETFDGLKVVIGFHNAAHHEEMFARQHKAYYKKAMKVVRIDAAAKPMLELLGLMAMFLALIPGAYLVMRGKTELWGIQLASDVMDSAQLGLIYVLLAGMLDPCRKLSSGFSRLKRATAAIDRIFQLMDQQSLITEPSEAKPLPRHAKSIEFKDVSFRYHSRDLTRQRGLALEHIDLKIPFGDVVAIVGQNGCGKSTLVNLLPRYYDSDTGDVLIDGQSIKDVALSDLRQQVGVVTQDTVLFDGTILDNIRYGSPQATMQDVEEAARKAHVLPIVNALPHGFETTIGGKGKELSGGQRQRIALARVILRDPAILILDEATSAADAESEALIHQALKEFVRNRTAFLISHTLSQSLLDFITRIVVMENGKVVAHGTHEQLLESCPLYHRLYHSPSRQMASLKAA